MDSRGDLRLARGLPSRPSTAPRVSASLEGSEPTLEQGESSPPRSRPPLDKEDKRPCRSPAGRTESLNANHSSTATRTDGVRSPFPTVAVTGAPSANSGDCSAIPDAVAALWEPATRDETCSAQFLLLFCQLRLSGLHLTTRKAPGPPPAREGVRCRHVPLKEGRSALAAGGPDLPPRGNRDLHVTPGPPSCTR